MPTIRQRAQALGQQLAVPAHWARYSGLPIPLPSAVEHNVRDTIATSLRGTDHGLALRNLQPTIVQPRVANPSRHDIAQINRRPPQLDVRAGGKPMLLDFIIRPSQPEHIYWLVSENPYRSALMHGHTSLVGQPAQHAQAPVGSVLYAGQLLYNAKGSLQKWNNNSGHYLPHPGMARATGLPMERFEAVHVGEAQRKTQMRQRIYVSRIASEQPEVLNSLRHMALATFLELAPKQRQWAIKRDVGDWARELAHHPKLLPIDASAWNVWKTTLTSAPAPEHRFRFEPIPAGSAPGLMRTYLEGILAHEVLPNMRSLLDGLRAKQIEPEELLHWLNPLAPTEVSVQLRQALANYWRHSLQRSRS